MFREKLDEYKTIQNELDALFEPLLKKFCSDCRSCCNKMPNGIGFDIELLRLDGSLPDVNLSARSPCPFLSDGDCIVKGLKPMICETYACDKIVNSFIEMEMVNEWMMLISKCKKIYGELQRLK